MRFEIASSGAAVVVDGNSVDGLFLEHFDLGRAAPRVVSRPTPRSGGSIDFTAHHSDRIVQIAARSSIGVDLLAFDALSAPGSRVEITATGHRKYPPMRMSAVGYGPSPTDSRDLHSTGDAISVGEWSVPAGVFSAISTPGSPVTARPGSTGEEPGIILPEELPWAMPPAPIVGAVTALSAGTAPSKPTIVIHGPVTNPAVFSAPHGYVTKLGMSIASGQFVVLDHTTRTAQLNGVPGGANSVHHLIDWAVSTWWPIHVGEQQITMTATAYAAPDARAVVTWDDAYL